MRRSFVLVCVLAVCARFVLAAAPKHFSDAAQFASELHKLGGSSVIAASLPAEWQVQTPQGLLRIPSEPLKHLDTAQQQKWLEYLSAEVEGFASAPKPENQTANARSQLDRILRDPGFSPKAKTKTFIDRLEDRLFAWVVKQLDKILRLAASHPTTSQALFWTALGSGLLFLSWRLFLLWSRPEPELRLGAVMDTPHLESYREWIAASRQAAAEGDFARAIQCAYWAGIVHLQDAGRLSKNTSLTPREYLRSIAAPDLAPHLRALTASLDRFWYAHRSASAQNLTDCLGLLEALGCQLD